MISRLTTDWKLRAWDRLIVGALLTLVAMIAAIRVNLSTSDAPDVPATSASVALPIPTVPPPEVLPHFTAGHLYLICEGEIGYPHNFAKFMFSGNAPCVLEGQRVMVTGETLPPASATSTEVLMAGNRRKDFS